MTDLTQQYAHYHRKWQQEQRRMAYAQYQIELRYKPNSAPVSHWNREIRLAKRRAQYANKRMCDVEAQNIAEGGQIGSLTWTAMWNHFPAIQDGYIIPTTPTMYQDD